MKSSILLLTILGMIAINVVTGTPIKDTQQEGPISAVISEVNLISREKRSVCENDSDCPSGETCNFYGICRAGHIRSKRSPGRRWAKRCKRGERKCTKVIG